MLEGLGRVNWKELGHAYGPAEDLPALIRDLAAEDAETREQARLRLWGTIIHQGTVYSATAYAVPFLLELLAAPATKEKPDLLVLVCSLACGSSYLDVHKDLFEDVPKLREEMQQPEWHDQLEEELDWVRAAHQAVVQGWQIYLRLLDDPEPQTRSCAAYALAVCRRHSTEIVPQLAAQLGKEVDDHVKASVLLSLGCVGDADCGPLLEQWLGTGYPPAVKACAALSMARIFRDRTSSHAVAVLCDNLQNPRPVDELYLQLPWSRGESVIAAASQALIQLGSAALAFVPRIAQGLQNLRPGDTASIAVVNTLLAVSFQPQKAPRAADFTEIQRSVLTSVVEADRAWDWGTVFFVLRQFGLPYDRKELAEFLGMPTENLGEGFAKRGALPFPGDIPF
jgi:hypothetical protein